MEPIHFTTLLITGILMVSTWVNCKDLKFKMSDYSGLREQAIVVLYLKNKRTYPLCYGVLVDWQKAVVPCECVSRGVLSGNVATAWFQCDPPKPVCRLDESNYEVGLMIDEYNTRSNPYDRRVSVRQIRLSEKCDGSYVFNYASLFLKDRIPNSRLVWVYSASEPLLQWQIKKTVVASATIGMCQVIKWVNDVKMTVRYMEHRPDVITELAKPDNFVIKTYPVTFDHWLLCVQNVCPRARPYQVPNKIARFDKYCNNEVDASRFCATWENVEQRLCDVLPGTPVFCDREGHIEGVVGLLYTRTTWCKETMNAVMTGFSNALELVKDDLRIQNAPGYQAIVANWEKLLQGDSLKALSSSVCLVVNSLLIGTFAIFVSKF